MSASILLLYQKKNGSLQELWPNTEKEQLIIGRSKVADIRIASNDVARSHCRIDLETKTITDLGGANGSRLNYEPLSSSPLSFGDVLECADHVLYFYRASPPKRSLLFEASDPRSTKEELYEIASYYDPPTLRALAKNPNAPPALLARLTGLYPEELWQNPLLSLLSLEDPMLSCFAPGALANLLAHSSAPVELLSRFAMHSEPELRYGVAKNPAAPAPLLRQLPLVNRYEGSLLLGLLLKNPNFQVSRLVDICEAGNLEEKLILASGFTPLPEDLYQRLAECQDEELKLRLIENANVPLSLRKVLVRDAQESLQDAVIERKGLRDFELRDFFVQVHGARVLAKLISAGVYASESLSFVQHKELSIRRALVDRLKALVSPHMPPNSVSALRELARDSDEVVRASAKEALAKLPEA